MHHVWKGTQRDFSNILFSRKFHPPLRPNGDIIEGEWYDWDQIVIIRMAAFKYFKYTEAEALKRYIQIINHEILHGVILGIQWKDKIPLEEVGDGEYALHNGMDPYYNSNNKKLVCSKCK